MTRGVTFTGTGLAVLLHAATIALVGDSRSSVSGIHSLPSRAQRNLAQPRRHSDAARAAARRAVGHRSAGQGRGQVSRRRRTGSAAVNAHQDCETAMAYGLRAGDHRSGSVSPTAWTFSVQKRAVSGRRTLVGLLTDQSDGAGPRDAVPMQRRSLTSLRAVLLTATGGPGGRAVRRQTGCSVPIRRRLKAITRNAWALARRSKCDLVSATCRPAVLTPSSNESSTGP